MHKNRANLGISCGSCPSSHLCITRGLSKELANEINNLITKIAIIQPGEHLYYIHDNLEYLSAVYSGTCKDYFIDMDGQEYVNNFYLSGDILGLESIPGRKFLFSAMAITKTEICLIPYEALLEKAGDNLMLQNRLLNIMAYKMQNDKQIRLKTNAKQRVADFLLNMYRRIEERNKVANKLQLPMSQFDISNLLGLAYETLSRILHGLAKENIIKLVNKEIHIVDVEALQAIGSALETQHGQMN